MKNWNIQSMKSLNLILTQGHFKSKIKSFKIKLNLIMKIEYQRPEGISTSESEDEYDDEIDHFELEMQKKIEKRKTKGFGNRISVSAEVYGEYNKKGKFSAPVYQKSKL